MPVGVSGILSNEERSEQGSGEEGNGEGDDELRSPIPEKGGDGECGYILPVFLPVSGRDYQILRGKVRQHRCDRTLVLV